MLRLQPRFAGLAPLLSRRFPSRPVAWKRSFTASAALREPQEPSNTKKQPPLPPPRRGVAVRAWDAIIDVISVTIGIERKRDIAAEYASGERAYPWVCYTEPATGRTIYYNSESQIQTEVEPPDWERFSTPASYVRPDEEAGALRAVVAPPSAWARTVDALGAAPIIEGAVKIGEARPGRA